MIKYEKKILDNGLTVMVNKDTSTPMAAVNLIYKVGAKNENPQHTGFAHLFEHLMFGGSKSAPNYDIPVQMAAGENNAFTNNDYTDYYIVLPKDNIETAFFLESDRMCDLIINEKSLETQKLVVEEEFNQRYLNKPYGDIWLLLRPLAYKVHPYRWATIGMSVDHIRDASLDMVSDFYNKYYNPSNAILSVSGDFEPQKIFELSEKWFGGIVSRNNGYASIPKEPVQTKARRMMVERDVPAGVLYIVFHIGNRASDEFNVCDTISDLLSNGTSSRLYQNLVKRDNKFTEVNAYVSGDVDEGLFIVVGYPAEGVSMETAEELLWRELEQMKVEPADEYELQKVKNKFESNTIFGEINVMNKAMNLGFYEMLGNGELINTELDRYKSVTADDIINVSKKIFIKENSSTLLYCKK